jgi:hypothetical protein
MYCFFKNCYCIWRIVLKGFPVGEASEHISLFFLSSISFLGFISLFSYVLGFCTIFYVNCLNFGG